MVTLLYLMGLIMVILNVSSSLKLCHFSGVLSMLIGVSGKKGEKKRRGGILREQGLA